MTGGDEQPKMHADEIGVDRNLVEGLIASQFARWSGLELRRTKASGTDNVIYRLGRDMGVRLPKIWWAVDQVEKEWRWLPALARDLPVEVPEPLAVGKPDLGYPHSWLVYRWLEGTDLEEDRNVDWAALAEDLARFASSMSRLSADDAPLFRRTLLSDDQATRRSIDALDPVFRADRLLRLWEEALDSESGFDGAGCWVHGDLLPGNIIHRSGRMTGIIDWSVAGVGDPSRDLMIAWAMPEETRSVYRALIGLDDAAWSRGRGWVIDQCSQYIVYYRDTIPAAVAGAERRLLAVLEEGGL
ncbi:MAG: aminoglycoside phosphotransferase family protein [Acidimicrobiales bacterium]